MKLTPDYLPIIVRAYNTGAATVHREDSHTLQEKVASYPIAYLDEVLSILHKDFPLNKKAEAPKKHDDFWDYSASIHFPDAWDYLNKDEDDGYWNVKKAEAKYITKTQDNLEKQLGSTATRMAQEATRVKYAALDSRDKAISAIEEVLCKTGGIKLNTAREYANASYGVEGVKLIDKLISCNNLEKTAQYRKETYIPDSHPFAKAFENFVLKNELLKKASVEEKNVLDECINTLNSYVRPKDRYIEDDFVDRIVKEGQVSRMKKDRKKNNLERREEFMKEAYTPASSMGVGGISGLEALNHPGWVGLDKFERELMYGLADPAHEARLRNIRVQTILTDLMNTDPYLKEKDPEEVVDAMNNIMEINPDLHKNKPMLRIALRQFMESGGMDIPTLGVLSEFGKEERERKSRERSQAESAAAQRASVLQTSIDAQKKLESEERRAKEDRESRERISDREMALREREFAQKYPELCENKGLVRRLISTGMSIADAAHAIRHPRSTIRNAVTEAWNRERRDRDLKHREEDAELDKRETDINNARNSLLDSVLHGDELEVKHNRRGDIRNQLEQQLDINIQTTDQEHRDLADILKAKHNRAVIDAIDTDIDATNAAERARRSSDITRNYAESLHNQILDTAQENSLASENRLMKQRAHDKALGESEVTANNLTALLNALDLDQKAKLNLANINYNNSLINSDISANDLANRADIVATAIEKRKQERENQKQDNRNANDNRTVKQFEHEKKMREHAYNVAHVNEDAAAWQAGREAARLDADTKRLNSITSNDVAKRFDAHRSEENALADKEEEQERLNRSQAVSQAPAKRVMNSREHKQKKWESDQREANKASIQQQFTNQMNAGFRNAQTNLNNAMMNGFESDATFTLFNTPQGKQNIKNKADEQDRLNTQMYSPEQVEMRLADQKMKATLDHGKMERAYTDRKQNDMAQNARNTMKNEDAIHDYYSNYGRLPTSVYP